MRPRARMRGTGPPRGRRPRGHGAGRPTRALLASFPLAFLALAAVVLVPRHELDPAPPRAEHAAAPVPTAALAAPESAGTRAASPAPGQGVAAPAAPTTPENSASPPADPPSGEDPGDDSPRVRLSVRVVDAITYVPCPRASLELRHVAADAGPLDPETVFVRRTDGRGELAIELAPGFVSVAAWRGQSAGGPEGCSLTLGPRGSVNEIEVALEPTLPAAGIVLDAATGEPVGGASVSFWTFAEKDRVRTLPDGTFVHERFPAGGELHQVRVEAKGYGPAVRYLELDAGGRFVLPATHEGQADVTGRGVPWIEVELVPELRVTGRLVDPDGGPVNGAAVEAEGYFHALPSVASRDAAGSRSDERGAFELAGLRSDVGHSVLVRAPGFAQRSIELDAMESHEGTEVDLGTIRLAPELLLSGVVLDPDGRPVEDIRVELLESGNAGRLSAAETEAPEAKSPLDAALRVQAARRTGRTGADGLFLFESLPPGAYRVAVARDGDELCGEELELDLHAPSPHLRMLLPRESLVLEGQVRDAQGVVGGAVVLVRRFGHVGRFRTDPDGRFRIAGLDDRAAYELEVRSREEETGAELVASAESWVFERPVLELTRR